MSLRGALARERSQRTEPELVALASQRAGLVNRQTAAPPPRVAGACGTGQPRNSRCERSVSPGQARLRLPSRDDSQVLPRQRAASAEPQAAASPLQARSQGARPGFEGQRGARAPRGSTSPGARQAASRSASANTRHAASLTAATSTRQVQSYLHPIQIAPTLEGDCCRGDLDPVEDSQGTVADVASLRSALDDTIKRLAETLSQFFSAKVLLKQMKAEQEAEIARLGEVFDALTVENKMLQATARQGNWKRQSARRAHDAEVQLQSEELQEECKRLELVNARLRKELAAMKSRLLGWQQIQKRSAATGRRQSSPPAKSLSASRSEGMGGA